MRRLDIYCNVVVFILNYLAIVRQTTDLSVEIDAHCPCVGHTGDGNLHFLPLADPNDAETVNRAMELNDQIIVAAIKMGDTATGEHGIRPGKCKFMRDEYADAVAVMQTIKHSIETARQR